MKIYFANRRLERAGESPQAAVREWGTVIGMRYLQRLRFIHNVPRFDDLRGHQFLRLHKLKGKRLG